MGYKQLFLGNTIGVVWLAFLLVSFAYLFIRSLKGLTPEVTIWTHFVFQALMASAILVFRN